MWQCTWSPIQDSVADPGLSRGSSNSEGIGITTSLLFCTIVDENCMKIKWTERGRAFFVLPRSVTEIYDLSSGAIEVPWPDVLRETGLTSLRMSPRGTFRIPSHNIDNYWLQFSRSRSYNSVEFDWWHCCHLWPHDGCYFTFAWL